MCSAETICIAVATIIILCCYDCKLLHSFDDMYTGQTTLRTHNGAVGSHLRMTDKFKYCPSDHLKSLVSHLPDRKEIMVWCC